MEMECISLDSPEDESITHSGDAGFNDMPLEFNTNSNPVSESSKHDDDINNKNDGRRDRNRRSDRRNRNRDDRRSSRDQDEVWESDTYNTYNGPSCSTVTNASNDPSTPVPNIAAQNLWSGMTYPVMGMNLMMDPNNMMGYNNSNMIPPLMQNDPSVIPPNPALNSMVSSTGVMVKEILHFTSCTLYPPNPNAPLPTTRERPPGCRTIFVGGLPENITEDILTEIFEKCGEITTLRLSKKNFCHIRFVYETSVDAAIYLSGYRIRIANNSDAPNSGRLHVDYAQARDDQYEWECRQRALLREQRHRERLKEEQLRPPSPPPVQHYTEHEAAIVSDKIKQDETFSKAVQVIITWLERGDCNKRNSNTFYSMIQSTNSHVRRLLSEKVHYEEELQKARDILKGRMQGILIQFGQIERVFSAACHKKVWDHFTKAQRKNIEMWKKQTQEIKTVQLEDIFNERGDEEMDVSDNDDETAIARKRARTSEMSDEKSQLKDENDSLRCQLEAYKNEVDIVRIDLQSTIDTKEKQIEVLQKTLKGMQQQFMESVRKQNEDETKIKDLQIQLNLEKNKETAVTETDKNDGSAKEELACSGVKHIVERDAQLIGLISIFLHVHPFGAGVDYIWSYLQKMESNLRPSDVENLMSKFPTIFKQELSGIGANMERRWIFNGFDKYTSQI